MCFGRSPSQISKSLSTWDHSAWLCTLRPCVLEGDFNASWVHAWLMLVQARISQAHHSDRDVIVSDWFSAWHALLLSCFSRVFVIPWLGWRPFDSADRLPHVLPSGSCGVYLDTARLKILRLLRPRWRESSATQPLCPDLWKHVLAEVVLCWRCSGWVMSVWEAFRGTVQSPCNRGECASRQGHCHHEVHGQTQSTGGCTCKCLGFACAWVTQHVVLICSSWRFGMNICNCLSLHDIFDKHGVGVVVLVVSFAAVVLVLPASFVDVCWMLGVCVFCLFVCVCLLSLPLFSLVYVVYMICVSCVSPCFFFVCVCVCVCAVVCFVLLCLFGVFCFVVLWCVVLFCLFVCLFVFCLFVCLFVCSFLRWILFVSLLCYGCFIVFFGW